MSANKYVGVTILSDNQAENVLAGDGAVNPTVSGVHAVVAQKKELIFTTGDELFLNFATGVGWHAVRQVRFVEFGAVDVDRAIFEENRIASDANDALNRKAFG